MCCTMEQYRIEDFVTSIKLINVPEQGVHAAALV